MISSHKRKTVNIILYSIVALSTFGVYTYITITKTPTLGYILIPAFACLILTAILDKCGRL